MSIWVLIAIAIAVVAGWATLTPWGRDELARDFGNVRLVLAIAYRQDGSRSEISKLRPYSVEGPIGWMTTLATDEEAAAEFVLAHWDALQLTHGVTVLRQAPKEGTSGMRVWRITGATRVVPLKDGIWGVALLPRWISFLARPASSQSR